MQAASRPVRSQSGTGELSHHKRPGRHSAFRAAGLWTLFAISADDAGVQMTGEGTRLHAVCQLACERVRKTSARCCMSA